MSNIWRLCLIFWCSTINGYVLASETASFYGASYISVPFQEAKSTTTISFKFRTKRSDAILFLSAGKIDYCLLRLESGRLKVHINLGAGDTEISTPRGLRLDDLLWHSVNVTRVEANVTLTVDLIHTTFEKLPGKFFELNIHYGLFIGGQGDFSELFLGHVDWLRGCMSDVIYNNIDTLKRARARSSQADAQGVLWTCSAEFDASHDSEISFVDDGAFLSLPQVVQRAGVRLSLELKTDAVSGVVVYSSGQMSGGRADFLGLEIVNRRPRLLLDTGNGVLALTSDLVVSTGQWLSITLLLSPSLVELIIDGEPGGQLKLPNQGTKYLDLADTIYIGGIELNKRARALSQGLKTADVSLKGCVRRLEVDSKPLGLGEAKSADVSLKGCVRRLEVDSKPLGLGEAKVSSGLLAECVWSYPCLLSPPPCTSLTPCSQLGVNYFLCECASSSTGSCDNPEYKDTDRSKTPLAVALEIIHLEPLTVSEGENTLLTSAHISLVLDAARYGVRDSGVMFHIHTPPSHGTLHLEIWEHDAHAGQMFTLLDLAKDKVRYIHDGSESRLDSFECEVALSPGAGFLLPGYLQGRHRFRFHIQITPVNDPPTLTIPAGKVLRLAQGTRKTLTPDLLLASDLDSPPSELLFHVNDSSSSSAAAAPTTGLLGHVELDHAPSAAFTSLQLREGRVQYVHTGRGPSSAAFKLRVQVSDGIATSNVAYLSVAVYPLQLHQVNNTGALLIHNSHTHITPTNLSFSVNSDDPEVVIVYKITTPPEFGSLQTLKVEPSSAPGGGGGAAKQTPSTQQATDNWQSASEFTDLQVKRSQVRYLHREGTPTEDSFRFTVSLRNAPPPDTPPAPSLFPIRFVSLSLAPASNGSVPFDAHSRELLLVPAHLSWVTAPLPVPPNTIVYKILRPLSYGNLSRRGNSVGLTSGDVFTQAEINTGELYYSLHRTTYSNVTDTLTFQVSAPHCEVVSGQNLSFVYTPDVSLLRKLTVTISNLQVVEGGQERLSGGIVCHGVSSLFYRVTSPPRHGRLDLTEAVTSKKIVTRNITSFSGTQLSRSLILYSHDDSESRTDRIEFVAVSIDKEDFQYIGTISVSVALTNDNAPHRSANQTLELVSDSSHLLLPSHLSYADEDMDATPHNIIYSVRASEGGALYSAVTPIRPLPALAEFSQADIDSGRVRYRHQSNLTHPSVVLRVSDGAHFVEGILHIHASAPYVRVVNSSSLVVKEGGEATLTPEHLGSETNVDMNPAQIKYDILEYPSYGELQFRPPPPALSPRGGGPARSPSGGDLRGGEAQKRGDLSITSFSQRDVSEGALVYVQNGALGPGHMIRRDVFKLRLDAGDRAWNDTVALVSIYPGLYYSDLVRMRNETLLIEESTGFVITRQSLLIEQPGVPASDIVYHVTQAPSYGYLELDPPLSTNDIGAATASPEPTSPAWFDQAAINEERLHYVQAGGQNRTQDFFLLDVTNGILWIRGLRVNIIIVPEHIYLSSGAPASVDEGGNITLLPSLLPLLSPYYSGRVTEYRVIRQCRHGALYFSSNRVAIMRWTPQQLQAGQIQYIHDGSESHNDSFTLVARAGDKESNPATVQILISPVNDQPPRLRNNTGLTIYRGATVTLSDEILACVDLDTPPENLTYTILSSHHGHLAFQSSPGLPIYNFSQAQIHSGMVVFSHAGDSSPSAGFEATVSDSVHTTPPFSFLASTRVPSLTLARASGLSVFPMLSKVISAHELAAWSSDRERTVLFVVTQLPAHGFLHVNDKAAYELPLNFTQGDVNASRVSYQHSSPFRDPDLNDTFRFSVRADFTEPILNQSFPIHISVSYGGLESLVTPRISLSVLEGGVSPIQLNTTAIVAFLSDRVGLHSPTLSLSLLAEPRHGSVCECRNNEHNRRKARSVVDGEVLDIEGLEGSLVDKDAIESLQRSLVDKDAIEGLQRILVDEDAIDSLQRSLVNEDAIEGLQSSLVDKGAIEGLQRSLVDKDTIEGLQGSLADKNLIEGLKRETLEGLNQGGLLDSIEALQGSLVHKNFIEGKGENLRDGKVHLEVVDAIEDLKEKRVRALAELERVDSMEGLKEGGGRVGSSLEGMKDNKVRGLYKMEGLLEVNGLESVNEDLGTLLENDENVHRRVKRDADDQNTRGLNSSVGNITSSDIFLRDKRKSFDLEQYQSEPISGEREKMPSPHDRTNVAQRLVSQKDSEMDGNVGSVTLDAKSSGRNFEETQDSEELRNLEYQRQYEAYYNRRAQEQRKTAHQPELSARRGKEGKGLKSEGFPREQVLEQQQMRGDAANFELDPAMYGSEELQKHSVNGKVIQNSDTHGRNRSVNGNSNSLDEGSRNSREEQGISNEESETADNGANRGDGQVRANEFAKRNNMGSSGGKSTNAFDSVGSKGRQSQADRNNARDNTGSLKQRGRGSSTGMPQGSVLSPEGVPQGTILGPSESEDGRVSQCSKDSGLLYFYDSVNLCYHHDHSDSLHDALTISIYLYPGDVLLTNISVEINVTPINDQPFALRTAKPHVSVVQGHEVRITARDLYTEDNDTSPEEIVYEIITQPTVGYIKIVDPDPTMVVVGEKGVKRRSVDEVDHHHVRSKGLTLEEVGNGIDKVTDDNVREIDEKGLLYGVTNEGETARRANVDIKKPTKIIEAIPAGRDEKVTKLDFRKKELQTSVQKTTTGTDKGIKIKRITEPNAETIKEPSRFAEVNQRERRDINVMNDIPVSRHAQNYASNFTQADVNTGRVVYVHNSNNTGTISFYFRVHDGKFNPVYNLFNINIVPIRLAIDIRKPVNIRQTDSLATIPAGIFSIQSNLNSYAHLRFIVTRPPINGNIYVSEKKAESFTYPDLEAGNVLYMQTNMASFADMLEVECDVLNLIRLDKLYVNITVQPLINVTTFEPISGTRNKISSDVLNVDTLATLSNTNPLFKVIKKPRYGKLKKIIRASGSTSGEVRDLRESEISRFTYDQLRHGVVYYVPRKLNASVTDCFVYLLNASVYQPAIGEFCFRVGLQATPPLNSPKSRINNNYNSNIELSSPNISNDYAMIVGMIAAVILLSVVIVFFVRMRSKRLVRRKKSLYASERRDEHVIKSDASLSSAPPDDVMMMTSSALPLNHGPGGKRGGTGGGGGMIKYPYGAVDGEEEEGGEGAAGTLAGAPPLRRNQYWV